MEFSSISTRFQSINDHFHTNNDTKLWNGNNRNVDIFIEMKKMATIPKLIRSQPCICSVHYTHSKLSFVIFINLHWEAFIKSLWYQHKSGSISQRTHFELVRKNERGWKWREFFLFCGRKFVWITKELPWQAVMWLQVNVSTVLASVCRHSVYIITFFTQLEFMHFELHHVCEYFERKKKTFFKNKIHIYERKVEAEWNELWTPM